VDTVSLVFKKEFYFHHIVRRLRFLSRQNDNRTVLIARAVQVQ